MNLKPKYIIVFFIALIYLMLHILKVQFTPFFLYGMYSKAVGEVDTLVAYEIEVDKTTYYPFDFGREKMELILGPLDYYNNHLRLNGQDPVEHFVLTKRPHWNESELFNQIGEKVFTKSEELQRFPFWYKTILERSLSKKINHLIVYEVKYTYTNYGLKPISKNRLIDL